MNHIVKTGLVSFALLTLTAAQALAADLYVDPSGGDAGDFEIGRPAESR